MSILWQLNLYEKIFKPSSVDVTFMVILYFLQISFTIERPKPCPPVLSFSLVYLSKILLTSLICFPKE